ncbi:MAG: DUF6456 domain-containing protein [Hyphomicrobiaceae bacterium]
MEDNTQPIVSIGTFAEARKRGWVDGDTGADGLRITRAGREVLRRYRTGRVAAKAGAGPSTAASQAAATPSLNPKESPLTWLASRRDSAGKPMLNRWEVDAGERLRADLSFAHLTPRVTMGWSGIPISGKRSATAAGGHELTDSVVAARMRVTDALRAVGPEFSDILIDVCGHLRGLEDISRSEGWPRRAARLILQRALSALARHYKMGPEVRVEETIARRLRHWGSDDYRPSLDRWRSEGDQAD